MNRAPCYGAVTTGSSWLFLRLDAERVTIDLTEYFLREVDRIVGILVAMTTGSGPTTPRVP